MRNLKEQLQVNKVFCFNNFTDLPLAFILHFSKVFFNQFFLTVGPEQFWKQNTICLQFSIGFLFFEIFVGFYIFHIVSRCTGNRRLQSLYHVIKCINPPFLVYIKTFEIPTSAMIWHFRGKWKMFYLVCCFIQLLQTRNYYVWDCRLLIGIS